jgi:hypothetical protein
MKFSLLFYLIPLGLSSAPCSQTSSAYVPPSTYECFGVGTPCSTKFFLCGKIYYSNPIIFTILM